MRLIHLSDIHVWWVPWNPLRLIGKRLIGASALALGRARRFRLERLPDLVERVLALDPEHLIITGDLTTLATPEEFAIARAALAPLLADPSRATVIPGNHDRYTRGAARGGLFERAFGEFSPGGSYPWLRVIGAGTAILGLDPTRPGLTARGVLSPRQLEEARRILEQWPPIPRLLVACHYPVIAPPAQARALAGKPMIGSPALVHWLEGVGRHLYLCGHVHRAWAFRPPGLPDQLSLNPGPPLMTDPSGDNPPGFLEVNLYGPDVHVVRHSWSNGRWSTSPFHEERGFFSLRALEGS